MKQTAELQGGHPHPFSLWILKALLLVLGISALVSGLELIIDPTGKLIRFPEGSLDGSPFSNYLIPGILLAVCIGLLPLTAWFALWKKPHMAFLNRINPFPHRHWAWAAALKSGFALLIWISVQMTMVPYSFLQPLLLCWALLILLLCFAPGIRAFYALPVLDKE